jgi:hypothetical protein
MQHKVMDFTRRVVSRIKPKGKSEIGNYDHAEYAYQEASDLIKKTLEKNKPCMIARFGSGELNCVSQYRNANLGSEKYMRYILGEIDSYRIHQPNFQQAFFNAGIFPVSDSTLIRFAELMLKDMREVDILGSWVKEEKLFKSELEQAKRIRLPDIEPYYHSYPWSACLKDKDVLVIHPFADTINQQYKKREYLFTDSDVLPEFNLKTIKAVQSIAGQETDFADWFEALDHMKNQISQTSFDVAIIGCGAYGFPLAAHVKRIGKKAVHIGGATQILFGIKGARWNNHEFISSLYNEYWTTPSKEETPLKHKDIEGGCYWL